ncbi:PIH1 domain-containing protein 1-like isoform X2 [Montipora capricornis]|uniref:PIH1 domain-containing protein 1-like isoform X2 n=1 Tax=Montipora capricornis TaxID=246305 RepID=UPI0035F11156
MADDSIKLDDEFYRTILLADAEKLNELNPDMQEFVPKPGYVIKLRNSKEEKVFINICTSEKIPAPREINDTELVNILESVDATQYRVPMSLGEAHVELDNKGQGCTAYDVAINPIFYDKMQNSELFHSFFLTIVFEGLETKYNIELERKWTVLKNRKCMGSLHPHCIRSKSKPVIMEMDNNPDLPIVKAPSKAPKIEEVNSLSKGSIPKYKIIQEPPQGRPEFLVIEILLPEIKSTKDTTLDIGEDRLLLHVNPVRYHLDINLPFEVDNEMCGAQFNRKSKVLLFLWPVLYTSSNFNKNKF